MNPIAAVAAKQWMIMALVMNGNVMDKDHLQFDTYNDCQKKVVELNSNTPVVALLTTPKFPRVCIPIKDVIEDTTPVKAVIKKPAKAPVPPKVAVNETPKPSSPQLLAKAAPSHPVSADTHKPSRHL